VTNLDGVLRSIFYDCSEQMDVTISIRLVQLLLVLLQRSILALVIPLTLPRHSNAPALAAHSALTDPAWIFM
jgi:hypothetical protein